MMASKFFKRFYSQAKKITGEAVKQIEKNEGVKATEANKGNAAVAAKGNESTKEKKSTEGKEPDKEKKHDKNKSDIPFEKCCKRVNVSLQGANTRAGFAAALLLKQHPLIKKIYMYDAKLNTSVAGDLNAIDSSARVEAFCGDALPYSLRAADIVVLIDTDAKEVNMKRKLETSYYRVKKFAETCNLHCPKAVIVVNVEPVCCMTSLVQCVLEDTPFYHPSRLLGNVSGLQSIINTIVARKLHLDPTSVHVPLLGGPDVESVVPLISLMSPDPGLSLRDQAAFFDMVKKEADRVASDFACYKSTMHDGYAIGKMCLTIAKGLNGHQDALATVVARSTQAYPLKYLVSTARFGPGGMYHNYGIPKLTTFELQELEKSILLLEKRTKHMRKAEKSMKKAFVSCTASKC